jgi:hypothetical protein
VRNNKSLVPNTLNLFAVADGVPTTVQYSLNTIVKDRHFVLHFPINMMSSQMIKDDTVGDTTNRKVTCDLTYHLSQLRAPI